MLIKLQPDQVATHWKPIRRAIEASLPPVSNGAGSRMDRVLNALLIGEMQCWISQDKNGRVDSILTTSITRDELSGHKNLMIFSLFGLEAERRSWLEGFKALAKFARSKGCTRIIGYSSVDSIASFVERLGGDSSFRFISIPLGDGS